MMRLVPFFTCVVFFCEYQFLLSAAAQRAITKETTTRSFEIYNDTFFKDGEPFQVKAGCVHYSRVPVEYWQDRLQRLKAMGLNAIQTYVPWNWHEAKKGTLDFATANRNLTQFLSLAQQLDMVVVLRAGPYMCGEWEFGGLPAWLFENGSISIRTYAQPYMNFALSYWREGLLPQVKPMLYENGGPVVMVQVENEYGSYGNVGTNPNDAKYMHSLIDAARNSLGQGVLLFTTDGGDTSYMSRGSFKGDVIYTVGDGCGNPQTCIDAQKSFNAEGKSPFFCSECYTGWLTHWSEQGANTSSSAPHVESILSLNGSVSLYMGHGGTNFGFTSGANGGGGSSFQPHETSYDYDSPISEAGEHGYHAGQDKFELLKDVFSKYTDSQSGNMISIVEPPLPPRKAFGDVHMKYYAPLLDNIQILSPTAASSGDLVPPFAESVGCFYGFIMYSTLLKNPCSKLTLNGVRDRAQIFVDGLYISTVYRVTQPGAAVIQLPAGAFEFNGIKSGSKLQILVENMGRINFSHGMDNEIKGITGNVTIDGILLGNWTTHCLPLEFFSQLDALAWQSVPEGGIEQTGPTFYRGIVSTAVNSNADSFLSLSGWGKGVAWMNSFNLGRYWPSAGPQQTLYVPGPWTAQTGDNKAPKLTIFELETSNPSITVELVEQPQLQPVAPGSKCDPTLQGRVEARVVMYSLLPKLAHQQSWTFDNDTGHFALKTDTSLCVAVEPGCPHSSSGCLQLQKCDGSKASTTQTFKLVTDLTKAGAHNVHHVASGNCLDIFSHDGFDGAPLEIFSCYAAGEDNQRFNFDPESGTLTTLQGGPTTAPFVMTACGIDE